MTSLIIMCLFSLVLGAWAVQHPLYEVKITDVTPQEGSIEDPEGVTSEVKESYAVVYGDYMSQDKNIGVTGRGEIEWTWTPQEYFADSVSPDKGISMNGLKEMKKADSEYYKIIAENDSGDYEIDFTFQVDFEDDVGGDIAAVDIEIYAKCSSEVSIELDNGKEWKTLETFKSSSNKLTDFSVGEEYISSNTLKIKFVTLDDDDHELNIDYMIFKPIYEDMISTITLPNGTYLSGFTSDDDDDDITYSYKNDAVSFDLSDYLDFDTESFGVNYSYTYTLSLSDFTVEQKPHDSIKDNASGFDVDYEESFKISAPFAQEIEMEARPTSTLSIRDFQIDGSSFLDSSYVTFEGDKILFTADSGETVTIKYSLKNPVSVKTEMLHNQTSAKAGTLEWLSTYFLDGPDDVYLKNITLVHPLIGDRENIEVNTYPRADAEYSVDGDDLLINIPSMRDTLQIDIKEMAKLLISRNGSVTQITDPIDIGTWPKFSTTLTVTNPSENSVKMLINSEDMSSIIPELASGELDENQSKGLDVELGSKESKEMTVYFTLSPISKKEGNEVQVSSTIGKPLSFTKKITIINPNNVNCSNVKWTASLPIDVYDALLDEMPDGSLGSGSFQYTEEVIGPNESIEHNILYYIPAVKKKEETKYGGFLGTSVEKIVTLSNPNGVALRVDATANVTGMSGFDEDELSKQLGDYTFKDTDGDGADDLIVWSTTVDEYDDKTVTIKGSAPPSLSAILPVIDFSGGGLISGVLIILVAGFFGSLVGGIVLIRYIRQVRRKRMLEILSIVENALKPADKPAAKKTP